MINKVYNLFLQKILIVIFIFCILTVTFSLFVISSNKIKLYQWNQYDGIYNKTMTYSNEKYIISVDYPSTKNKNVSNKLLELIKYYTNKVETDTRYFLPTNGQKIHLDISYNLKRANKNIISFIFKINYRYYKSNHLKIITKTYNLISGKELFIQNFFDERLPFSDELCSKVKYWLKNNKDIKYKSAEYFINDIDFVKIDSFDGYSFSDTDIFIYLNPNKISSTYQEIYEIKIPWDEISHLLKKNIILKKD